MREHTDLWQTIQPRYEEPPSESSREHKNKEAKTHEDRIEQKCAIFRRYHWRFRPALTTA